MLELLISSINLAIILKIGFLILNVIAIIFLLIVLKQARAMQKVIDDGASSILLNSIALINVIIGVIIFVAALIIL
jgi:hypothetical protein